MRVLLVYHGGFPDERQPVTGGGLRAWHHAEALAAAGHEVLPVHRAQDPPGPHRSFADPDSLRRIARELAPDVLLCVEPEDAPALAGLGLPLVVDLYAPRLLEAQFHGGERDEAVRLLRALSAGDFFLFTSERQRWFYLGLLALAGVGVRDWPGAVVPLAAPPRAPEREPPPEPLLVAGGVFWPWLSLEPLERAARRFEERGRGRLLVFGGPPPGEARGLPELPRLERGGWLPYPRLLERYARATAALDAWGGGPERELALSFRQLDYLAAGLPVLAGAEGPLAPLLRESGAGLVGLPVEEAVDRLLDEPAEAWERRSRAALELARGPYSRERCEAPLLRWLESPRRREPRGGTLLGELAEALHARHRAELEREALRLRLEAAETELRDKRAEVEGLVLQLQRLTSSVEQLSGAVAEVAGFRRRALDLLGRQRELERERAEQLAEELALARADVAKKTAELRAMEDEQRRLEHDLEAARQEIERLRRRGLRLGW